MRKLVMMLLLILIAFTAMGLAQTAPVELGVSYNWMRTSWPPAVGGAQTPVFNMNGGDASIAWRVNPQVALLADFGAIYASGVPQKGYDLRVFPFVFGPRVYLKRKAKAGVPEGHKPVLFGQILMGEARASGWLSGEPSNSANAFAMKIGGGVEVPLNARFALQPATVQYFLTLFPNTVNNRQNNFLFSSGLVMRFGKPAAK
jgi:hypothetical protein